MISFRRVRETFDGPVLIDGTCHGDELERSEALQITNRENYSQIESALCRTDRAENVLPVVKPALNCFT